MSKYQGAFSMDQMSPWMFRCMYVYIYIYIHTYERLDNYFPLCKCTVESSRT